MIDMLKIPEGYHLVEGGEWHEGDLYWVSKGMSNWTEVTPEATSSRAFTIDTWKQRLSNDMDMTGYVIRKENHDTPKTQGEAW